MHKALTDEKLRFIISSKRSRYKRLRKKLNNWEKEKENHFKQQNIYVSRALKLLEKNVVKQQIQNKKRRKKPNFNITIPQEFSFLDSYEKVFELIYTFIKLKINFSTRKIYIDHYDMSLYDLTAESVIDYIVSEYNKESKNKISISGLYPRLKSAERFIRSIGIIDEFKIKKEKLSKNELLKIDIFKVISRMYPEKDTGITKRHIEEVSINLVKYIDNCLKRVDRILTADAKQNVLKYVTEILENILEHSGELLWKITGYLDVTEDDNKCEISIFNFGKTMAETFTSQSKEDLPWNNLSEYVNKHLATVSEDNLITVFALQQGVSSKNITRRDTRGEGTFELISFFQTLHKELQGLAETDHSYAMALMSGNTYIRFDKTTQFVVKDEHKQIISFNNENSLMYPPCKKKVQHTRHFFPGTIIAIRFHLPSSMIKGADNGRTK